MPTYVKRLSPNMPLTAFTSTISATQKLPYLLTIMPLTADMDKASTRPHGVHKTSTVAYKPFTKPSKKYDLG